MEMLNHKQDIEALRLLLDRTEPDVPSFDFTSAVMEKIAAAETQPVVSNRRQWIILFISAALTLVMAYFPIWSWLGIEFTPLQFLMYYAGVGITYVGQFLGVIFSSMAQYKEFLYIFPAFIALCLMFMVSMMLEKRKQVTAV